MSEHDQAAVTGVAGAGLCNGCMHQRVVESGRGSRFSLCRMAADDARLTRYPQLPVLYCPAYERVAPEGGSAGGGSSSSSSPSSSPSTTSSSGDGDLRA
jgi:hypothetical protein